METIKPHVFSNGLPAVYIHSPNTRVLTAVLLVGAGSRFETNETKGISRFYANICFQGTQEYPEKDQLWETIDQLGLIIKPTVYSEYSLYYFSAVKEKFLSSFDLFLKILFQPSLTEQGLVSEKQLTNSEIQITSKSPQFLGLNKLTLDIFNNTSMGFDILGSAQGINNITRETLEDFKNKYYVSQNCLLVIVGPGLSLPDLEKSISIIPNGQRQTLPSFDFSQTKIIQDKVSQLSKISYLTFGSLCFGRSSDKRIIQSLLVNILIEGRKNKRLKTLREKKLVGAVRPWIKIFSDCGLFLIQASCGSNKEKEVLEKMQTQFRNMSSGSITQEELDIAKSYYQNRLLTRLDNNLELGLFYALGYFFNLVEQTPEQVIEKVKSVSLEEINETSQSIFRPEGLSWIVVGQGY